jgi:hypothetical protein
MILLLSEKYDKVSDNVIEWLLKNQKEFQRIDFQDYVSLESVSLNTFGFNFLVNGRFCNLSSFSSIWHRRARLNFITFSPNSKLNESLFEDQKKLNIFLENVLKNHTNYLGSYVQEVENNKLQDLYFAKQVGFNIADTIVTTQKKTLKTFAEKYLKIISKQLSATYNFIEQDYIFSSSSTMLISTAIIEASPDTFAPTLFQQYIEKFIEIRVYFFLDTFYSMAIFSQNDHQTSVDYRNYNEEKPNRNVPFLLPDAIQNKLNEFIKLTKYTTGSFDLILTPTNKYYFLEINPSSQFHWVSKNCNYYIEKEIAEKLY